TLSGTGTVNNITATGGKIAPGDSPGILTSGNVTLNSASTVAIEINGTTVGTQYDRLSAIGGVNLNNAALSVTLGYAAAAGDAFNIIQSSISISGTFAGLSDGSNFCAGGTV